MQSIIKDYLLKEVPKKRGLLTIEWFAVAYIAFTCILILIFNSRIHNAGGMLLLRGSSLFLLCLGYFIYQKYTIRLALMLRVGFQISLLTFWYPDLYEISRIFPNLDHVFASLEQSVFGCQPAILFSEKCPSPLLSECFHMGYFFYFPMVATVLAYYYFAKHDCFEKAGTIILGSFFVYYIVFLFLPVAGPQYYFNVIGMDSAAAGNFPAVGHWFDSDTTLMDTPGWRGGIFYKLMTFVHQSERPVASFPSSHVGVSVIMMILAFKTRSKWLISVLMPLWILLVCATVYIRAHYVVDVIAGFLTAPLVYWMLNKFIKGRC